MAETSKIYSALSAIMSECPAIAKSQKNQQQGFMYRGVDVVMNVLQPLMIKHKVFAVPEVLDSQRQERVTSKGGTLNYTILRVRYTFYAEDGSSVSAVVQGEGMDSADKSSNKAAAQFSGSPVCRLRSGYQGFRSVRRAADSAEGGRYVRQAALR